jgi:DNA-directed RNA polymerase subunit omega
MDKMIESLRGEEIVDRVGGRFKLTALIQHRARELMDGSRPLVERQGRSDIEVAVAEIHEGKIHFEFAEDEETNEAES